MTCEKSIFLSKLWNSISFSKEPCEFYASILFYAKFPFFEYLGDRLTLEVQY